MERQVVLAERREALAAPARKRTTRPLSALTALLHARAGRYGSSSFPSRVTVLPPFDGRHAAPAPQLTREAPLGEWLETLDRWIGHSSAARPQHAEA